MTALDYIFTITDQATGTVTLTSSPYAYNGGAGVTADRKTPTVGETLEIRLKDTSGTANLDELHTLNRLLQQAEDAQNNRAINRVYLTWQLSSGAETWRSEIKSGRAEPNADALKRGYWANNSMFAPVYLERANYWEGTLTPLSLSNPNGTATSGVTIYNHWDAGAGHVNYVQIEGTSIGGDLPAPLFLTMNNNYNNASGVADVWAGMNCTSDPANFSPVLEGETATVDAGFGGTAADANCSGAGKASGTISSDGDFLMMTWTLGTGLLSQCNGNYFKALLRFPATNNITACWFRPDIYYNDVVPLYTGDYARFDTNLDYELRELGVIQLPPWLSEIGNPEGLSLRLYGKRITTGNKTLVLDYLYLMPTESFVHYVVNGAVAYQSSIISDGIVEKVYTENSDGTLRRGDVVAFGGKSIIVKPGRKTRLYFLTMGQSDGAAIARTLSIKASYRPRRLTL